MASEALSPLRQAVLQQARAHLAADMTPEKQIETPLTSGRVKENQYGDGGYCSDFHIWNINTLYRAHQVAPPFADDLGFGYGTYQLAEAGKALGAVRPEGLLAAQPGDIVTIDTSARQEAEGVPYDGHTVQVLKVQPHPTQPDQVMATVFSANSFPDSRGMFDRAFRNIENETNAVNHVVFNPSTGKAFFTDPQGSPTDTSPAIPARISAVIDIDRLPNAGMVNARMQLQQVGITLPAQGYLDDAIRAQEVKEFDVALSGVRLSAVQEVAQGDAEMPNDLPREQDSRLQRK